MLYFKVFLEMKDTNGMCQKEDNEILKGQKGRKNAAFMQICDGSRSLLISN